MDDRQGHVRLRVELAALGHELDDQLGNRDLSAAIERSLRQTSDFTDSWHTAPRRRAAAVILVGLASVLAIPPARAAIADFLSIGAIRIESSGAPAPSRTAPTFPPSAAVDHFLENLGDVRTLASVRDHMPVLVPSTNNLTAPDQVRFETSNGLHASLAYRASPQLPALTDAPDVGLLIEEFVGDGRTMVRKYRSDRTVATPVDINGSPGAYLSGGPHLVFYEGETGQDVLADGRTVGRALIFQHGKLTIRIEANLPRSRMVAIARSL